MAQKATLPTGASSSRAVLGATALLRAVPSDMSETAERPKLKLGGLFQRALKPAGGANPPSKPVVFSSKYVNFRKKPKKKYRMYHEFNKCFILIAFRKCPLRSKFAHLDLIYLDVYMTSIDTNYRALYWSTVYHMRT